jgi:hypothetical protein
VRPAPAIELQCQALAEKAQNLEHLLAEHVSRIAVVLRQQDIRPEKPLTKDPVANLGVPLADRLSAVVQQLEKIENGLRHITALVEL